MVLYGLSDSALEVGIEIYRERKPIKVESIKERIRNTYIKAEVPKALEELATSKMIEHDVSGAYTIAKEYVPLFEEANEKVEEFDRMLMASRREKATEIECQRLGIRYKRGHPGLDLLVGRTPQKDGLEILADIGREQIQRAKEKYGKNWKKVPLKEIFEL
jgi:hypothetical protein